MSKLTFIGIAGQGLYTSPPFNFLNWVPVSVSIGRFMAFRFRYPGGFVSYIRNNTRRAPWIYYSRNISTTTTR